ncbi:MAG: S1-like domain-containing RNA-binding protein [Bacteroidales bacterium]|nr:S1-like domain-containing RNA-binding protein [Bacteroidales bacterium]
MVRIGDFNKLEVLKSLDFGIYLDGGNGLEILMPKRYVPQETQIGDFLDCFVYLDSEDRLLATTEKPYAKVGEFALLRVNSSNQVGAFMDWGVSKELLVPFREQKVAMEEGRSYLIYIYLDDASNRLAGSAKLNKFLDNTPAIYEPNQEVDLIIMKKTDIGYKVIINSLHTGLIYDNQIFTNVNIGDKVKGYIKEIREDGKIDVMLQPMGYEKVVGDLEQTILQMLDENEGALPYNDKTDPDTIMAEFHCSKKNFKKAIGALYKEHVIEILDNGIKLIGGK